MLEVLEVAENTKSTAADLENVIIRDQALSAKVLKVANSAYYGIPSTVETVSRATVLLGFQTVVGLSLTVSVYDTLWGAGSGNYLDRRELWKHSLGVATAAKLLSKNPGGKEGGVAFTAGMLHDVGKTIFDSSMMQEYGPVIEACQKDGIQIYQAEKAILGVTHADLGYKLARHWQLPDVLCESIRYHHSAGEAEGEYKFISAIINMADSLTRYLGIGQCGDHAQADIDDGIMAIWGGSKGKLKLVADELASYREKIDSMQP